MKYRQLSKLVMVIALMLMIGETVVSAQPSGKRGKGRRGPDTAPKVGDDAPNFKLKSLDGKSETELSVFEGEKPVVLIFGSYT